ncbi:MAG: hypothetical protein RSG77_17835 [Hafnia sp.]
MFQALTKIKQLLMAMNEGIVCMVCPTDTDGSKNLIVSRHPGLIEQISKVAGSFAELEPYLEVEDSATVIHAYDLLAKKVVEIKPHIFNGTAHQIGSIHQFDGVVRGGCLLFKRDQEVEIFTDGEVSKGTIVFINEKSSTQRYIVLRDDNGASQTLMFDANGRSEDGAHSLTVVEGEVEFWQYIHGGTYQPAIDLREDGFGTPYPLIFVVGYDSEAQTIATDLDGKSSTGEQLFNKVKVNMLPVECEYYLLINDRDVVCISKESKQSMDIDPGAIVLPVLAYLHGLEIKHVTLLARS